MCLLVPCSQKQSTRRKGRLAPARPPPSHTLTKAPWQYLAKSGAEYSQSTRLPCWGGTKKLQLEEGKGEISQRKATARSPGPFVVPVYNGKSASVLASAGLHAGREMPAGGRLSCPPATSPSCPPEDHPLEGLQGPS